MHKYVSSPEFLTTNSKNILNNFDNLKMKEILNRIKNNWNNLKDEDEFWIFQQYAREGKRIIEFYVGDQNNN